MPTSDTYDIKPYILARWLLPKPHRKTGLVVLMKTLLYPLFQAHDRFIRYREAKNYELLITTQVAWLERLLNDKYDSTQRLIYINDAEWHLPVFLYQEAESQPVYIYTTAENQPKWLYMEAEAGMVKDDFVVNVPQYVVMNESEMRSYLDQYKLFGTKYKIQRYAA